jgi:hypothetical protein
MRPDTNETPRLPGLDQLRDEFLRAARTETSSPTRRRSRLLAIGVAVTFGVAGAIAGIALNADTDQNTDTEQATTPPPPGGIEASGPIFASLDELVANSELILVGTVQQVQAGPDEGFDDEGDELQVRPGEIVLDAAEGPQEYPTRDLNTVIAVEDVLKGSAPTNTVTVATLELAYGGAVNDPRTDWRRPGVRVIAFLSKSPEGRPVYIASYVAEATAESQGLVPGPNYDQSFYIIDGNDLVAAMQDPSLTLNAQIEAMSLTELSQAVKKAATRSSD